MYLTAQATDSVLDAVAAWPGGGEIVFDYTEPPNSEMSKEARAARDTLAERVAAIGEPLIGFIEPNTLHKRLRELGYTKIEDLSGLALAERFLDAKTFAAARTAGKGRSGAHLLYAAT